MRISNSGVVALLVAALLGAAVVVESATNWCVAKPNLSETAYQDALDWVCGPLSGQGQVNCGPIQSGQSCYSSDTQTLASWAMNAYYQEQGQAAQSCDFQGTATITTSNPSTTLCTYAAPNGTSSSGNGTTPPGGMGNLLTHSSYLSAVVSILAYFTAQALH